MTTITLDKKLVEKEIGKLDEKMQEKILMAGVEIDSVTEGEITLDITPNRPDLLSFHGFVRYMKNYLGKSKPKTFSLNKPQKNFEVLIEKEITKEWPYAVCAIIKGVKLNDAKIKEIVDIQEKLTNSMGRKRKKLGIGVYPLDKISLPLKYTGKKPHQIIFKPLEFPRELNGLQVLSQHPTGREYGDLIKDWKTFPVFVDSDKKVLSMPPIVNSHETGKVTEATKDLFIECTGNNFHFVNKALNIFVSAILEMGGTVYQMKIKDEKSKKTFSTPDFSYEKVKINQDYINKNLGLNLSLAEIKKNLEKMGIRTEKNFALIPPYRTDILYEIDLVEEVAIAYGYENLIPEIPEISTIGEEDSLEKLKRKISEILSGIGLLECSSLHLNTKDDVKKLKSTNKIVVLEESKTENTVLRPNILTSVLKILSENSDSSYPQKIFETGVSFELKDKKINETNILEKETLAIALVDEKANFTELKRILNYLFKMLDKKYELRESEEDNFIVGRQGEIFLEGKSIGFIGEVSPRVLKNFKISVPVSALEIDLKNFLL